MKKKKKDILSAKRIQQKEHNKFLQLSLYQLEQCKKNHQGVVDSVPTEVFSKALKNKFLSTREQLMRRNFLT